MNFIDLYWLVFNTVLNSTLLIVGLLFIYKYKKHPIGYYFTGQFCLQIASIIFEYLELPTNLYLFSISYYFNYLFLSFYFFKYIFSINKKAYYALLILGCIPMVLKLLDWDNIKGFEAYDWIVYDAFILILTFLAIFKLIQKTQFQKNHLFICFGILAFFGLDFSVAFTMNYLVNGTFEIVSWIWIVRSLVLFGYFLTLSICTWKILKKA